LGEDTNLKENDYQYKFIHGHENFFHIEKRKMPFD
jgi:hypothetical protein